MAGLWDDRSETWDSVDDTWDDDGRFPIPQPLAVAGLTRGRITYYFYDLMSLATAPSLALLAEIPVTGVTFSQRLNASGSWGGVVDMADPTVKRLGVIESTRPGRTVVVVDVDGSIQWAGIIWTRSYKKSGSQLTLGANEGWSYWGRRVQAADYSVDPWSVTPTDPLEIAAQLIADAAAVHASAFPSITVNILEAFPHENPILASYPISSLQAVDSMVTTLAGGGYLTGFDFGMDASWATGPGSWPVFALNLSYPRRGRVAGSTGLIVDVSGDTDYTWGEDSSSQASTVYATASGTTTLGAMLSDPAVTMSGWPLTESTLSYSEVDTQDTLDAAAAGDLAIIEWPAVTAQPVVPLFGADLALGDFIMGDDIKAVFAPDDRFPDGIETYLRATGIDATIPEEGEATMSLTLTGLLSEAPIPPPPGLS